MKYKTTEELYANPLAKPGDIADFRLEGDACVTFPRQRMRLEQAYERDYDKGLHANFVLWCPEDFPRDIAMSWKFLPHSDKGLAMSWIAAKGWEGEDIFDANLAERSGDYPQYHHGDINAYHLSYFRRNPTEIVFQTCNLRKSHGFHMVAQAPDPLPASRDAEEPFDMRLLQCGSRLEFSINDLPVLSWEDDGSVGGPPHGGGKIGFRQMAGLIADYWDLRVHRVEAV